MMYQKCNSGSASGEQKIATVTNKVGRRCNRDRCNFNILAKCASEKKITGEIHRKCLFDMSSVLLLETKGA